MSSLSNLKFYTLLIVLLVSAGIGGAWASSTAFPWLHLSVVGALIILLLGQLSATPRIRFTWTLTMAVGIGTLYRFLLVSLPATLPGYDAEKYALFAQLTLQSGSSQLPTIPFYSIAGAYHTFLAQTAAIFGLPTDSAAAIVAVIIGITLPVFVSAIVLAVTGRTPLGYRAASLAVIIAAVMTMSVRFAYIPFAQSFGTVLFIAAVVVLVRRSDWSASRAVPIFVCLITTLTLTHKLVVLALAGIAGVVWTVGWIMGHPRVQVAERQQLSPVFAIFLGVAAFTQNAVITDHIGTATQLILATFGDNWGGITREGGAPAGGVAPDPGLLWPFFSHSHMIVMLAVGGLAWAGLVLLYWTARDPVPQAPITLLAAIAPIVAVTVITVGGVLSTESVQPMRVYALAEPLLAALIGIGLATGAAGVRRSGWGQVGTISVVAILVIFAVFSSTAAPAYPAEQRDYLTKAELTGKEFAADRLPTTDSSEIVTDDKLARETEHRYRVTDKNDPRVRLGAAPDDQFTGSNTALLEAEIIDDDPSTFLFRPNADVYLAGGGYDNYRYKLAWDVEQEADASFNRSYDNGDAILYQNPTE